MGFGLLFIGYLLSHGFTSGANYVVSIVGIVGAVIMFFGCRKLSDYSAKFKYAGVVSIAFSLAYVFSGLIQLVSVYPPSPDFVIPQLVTNLSRGLIIALVFVFNFYMYLGISDIARIAQVDSLSVGAVRNLVFMIIYYVVLISSKVIKPYFGEASGVLGLAGAVIGIVWLVLSVWCVMSAYMKICLEGDEEMSNPADKK